MSASRRKGTAWETAVVAYLRERGWPSAERRALRGARDCGDVAGIPGVVIEAKAAKAITLAAWADELAAEVDNDGADFGLLWIKRRGKSSPGDGYVVLRAAALLGLMHAAGYGNTHPEETP